MIGSSSRGTVGQGDSEFGVPGYYLAAWSSSRTLQGKEAEIRRMIRGRAALYAPLVLDCLVPGYRGTPTLFPRDVLSLEWHPERPAPLHRR